MLLIIGGVILAMVAALFSVRPGSGALANYATTDIVPMVVQMFVARLGSETWMRGFRSVWVVGPTDDLVRRLDSQGD